MFDVFFRPDTPYKLGGTYRPEKYSKRNFDCYVNCSGLVNFHCMQMSLGHDCLCMRWLFMFMFITFSFFGNEVISLESRPLIFLYLYTFTQSTQKQINEYDIKSKYPKEYSTVDKVGREKLFARKSSFV